MINRLRKENNGQALVELALILPILLLLVFGIVEFGRVFGTQLIVLHGAREGARAAAVGASDIEVATIIVNRTSPLTVDPSKLTIEILPSQVNRKRGDGITIRVQYPVTIYAPIISAIMSETYVVSEEVTMRME